MRKLAAMGFAGALAAWPMEAFAASAVVGYTGLINTPNSETVPVGALSNGFNWVDGRVGYIPLLRPGDNRVYFMTFGVMSGLEVTMRLTQIIGWVDPHVVFEHAFDRMLSVKYQLPLPEGLPRLAIGSQDILAINQFNVKGFTPGQTQYGQSTLYAVMTQPLGPHELSIGYGSSKSFINGAFGGATFVLPFRLSLLAEHDSQSFNVGLRYQPWPWMTLQLNRIDGTAWSAGGGISLEL